MDKKGQDSIKTVLIITVGFGLIYFFTELKWALYIALIIGVLGALSTKLSNLINLVWWKIAAVLSLIIPNVLLSLVFFLFLFPISLLYKIFGKNDTLQLKKNIQSLWQENNNKIDKAFFEKLW